MTSSSTAIVPWTPQEGREKKTELSYREARARKLQGARRWSAKKKWLMAASIVLAVGAAVVGSVWLGWAAVLPLLYLLPCLAMLAMCLKGMNGSGSERSGDA